MKKRCEFMYTHPIYGDTWQCTKWDDHIKRKGDHIREHTALAPSGWDPNYAIRLDGMPNNREVYSI